MRIVQINNVYSYGSTGRLVRSLHHAFKGRGYDAFVLFGRGNRVREKNVVRVAPPLVLKIQSLVSRITGKRYGGNLITTCSIINKIQKIKPDAVIIHCANASTVNIYRLLSFLKKKAVQTLLVNHAEFYYTGGCAHAYDCIEFQKGCHQCGLSPAELCSFFFKRTHYHWNKMMECIQGFDTLSVVAVSDWVRFRASLSPLFRNHTISVIYNGIDTRVFYARNETQHFRSKFHIPLDKKIVLFVTPNFEDPNKGGKFLIQLAERFVSDKSISFVVVGPNCDPTLLPNNTISIDYVSSSDELATIYSMADTTLVLSKRETFSMVCAESLCCGTPVVGFKAGGPESISINEFSVFSEYGDISAIVSNLTAFLSVSFDMQLIARVAKEKYSDIKMIDAYLDLINS